MVTNEHYRWDFIGLSTDTKPTPATSEKVVDGSTFYCSDTSKLYVYCRDNWYERKSLGGGGTSYTAGNGIDITDDAISVDTDVIQEKLTAGDNITIENGTISAAGSSVNVVQTTGTSTTDVMSQNATTSMVFEDPSTKQTVQIGSGATSGRYSESVSIGRNAVAYGSESVCIGKGAGLRTPSTVQQFVALGFAAGQEMSDATGSVSLGAYSKATRKGEVNIGSRTTDYGYKSTNYRVLGGVHDGQEAHDAVTVSQVNSVIDNINSALSTNIPHIGATS